MSAENINAQYQGVIKKHLPEGFKTGGIFIHREEIDARLNEVASEVVDFYQDKKPLVIVSVMTGALTVVADFRRKLYDKGLRGFTHDSIQVESYGAGTTSSGIIRVTKDLDRDPSGKHILIVDDIVDTAKTLDWLTKVIESKAKSVESFTLLSKPSRRKVKYDPRFIGFEVDDVWVEGYGMDTNEHGRENPDIIVNLKNE